MPFSARAGDAAIAMRLLWVSNIINLILDPCLIFGLGPFPRLGVTGAALATFTGRSIWCGLPVLPAVARTERLRILRRQIHVNLAVLLAPGSRVYHGYPAVFDCPHQLDRIGAHCQRLLAPRH